MTEGVKRVSFFVDGVEWSSEGTPLSRAELLQALRDELAWDGRVILEMISDGEALSEEDLLTVPDDIDVDVTTASEYGVGIAVLSELKKDLNVQTEKQSVGVSSENEMAECLEFARQALEMVVQTYPECDVDTDEYEKVLSLAADLKSRLSSDVSSEEFRGDWETFSSATQQFADDLINDLKASEEFSDDEDECGCEHEGGCCCCESCCGGHAGGEDAR